MLMKRLKGSIAFLMLFAMILSVVAPVAALAEEADDEYVIEDYSEFLADLKVLEGYADSYAKTTNEDPVALVLNYIRTGVDKYNEGTWNLLAGAPNTAFIEYVAEQDAANGTRAGDLRNLDEFTTPDGVEVEFEHMFGAMDMGYHNPANADFGSWAGDLVDLMKYSYEHGLVISDDVEAMAKDIRENYLGVDDPHASSFGWRDVYGDLDANYFLTQLNNGNEKLSALIEKYYTPDLTEEMRAINFLNDNFGRDTKDGVRAAMLKAYQAAGTLILEGSYGVDGKETLRLAAVYAFADYLFDLADGHLSSWGNDLDGPDGPSEPGEEEENDYYSVFSSVMSTLAPGVTQEIKYAQTRDKKQIVYYIATADVTRDDVSVFANYKNNVGTEWGFSSVTDQMAAALERHSNPDDPDHYIENYTPVVGVNGDFFNMMNAQPSGALVMEGVIYHEAGNEPFFAILDDGTPFIGTSAQWAEYRDRVREAIGASSFLVKDGELAVSAGSNYYTSRASRTCVGITEDNKVVLMVLDGRQEPFSAGGSAIEIAQIMLDAGCVMALNLDGGGSTTFAAKPEGADDVTVVNRPSDGFARGVSSSLMVVSTAVISYEFDHASISTQYDYMTVGAEQEVSYIGVSSSGNAAEIPEGAMLKVSDSSLGYMEGNVFHATGLGDVEIQFVLADGQVAGSKTLHIVVPDGVRFERENITAIYGIPMTMPVLVTYEGNAVVACGSDVEFELAVASAGTFDGLTFTASEEAGVRVTKVTVRLTSDSDVTASATINFFSEDEAAFDFDNADGGDRSLAWNREVSNSEKIASGDMDSDEVTYHILDPDGTMEITYLFALDMNNLGFPENIAQAIPVLAQFLNVNLDDVTAWQMLMVLAERVSPSTTVTVSVDIDPYMNVDYSGLVFNCECFEQKENSITWDEENHRLTLVCTWKNQTQALDANTINPIVSLSGIKLTPKEDAPYDANNQLRVTLKGKVEYDARIRSSQAFTLADSELGQGFGLYQYDNSENLADDKGAGFKATHCEFADTFTLDVTVLKGWESAGDNLWAYYENNRRLTGIHKLPDRRGGEEDLYYEFDENGVCLTPLGISGLFKMESDLYYAILGVLQTGWVELTGDVGVTNTYYFVPETGKAVDGDQYIDGYNFVFTDHVLTRGAMVKDSKGYRYRWGSRWLGGQWFELDGNKYFAAQSQHDYYLAAGIARVLIPGGSNWIYALFDDETCVWQEDYNGIFRWSSNNKVYYLENGLTVLGVGLIQDGDDYYFFPEWQDVPEAVSNNRYWVGKTNGLMPEGSYWFDSDSKLITAKYTVTWKNWNGDVLEIDENVPYGEMPKYDGATPTKEADAEYTYTFAGWDKDFAMVTGDVTYTATYTTKTNTYTITWLDEDGSELAKTEVEYGTVPKYPNATPTKEGDAQYSYTFAGWTPAVTAVTGDATYKATYTAEVNTYTVKWVNWNGDVLETDENVPYGTIPTYDGTDPTRAANAQYTYTWTGWDPAIGEVTGDITYTAIYTAKVNEYTVTWVNWNGDVLETDRNVPYGTMPEYNGATPTRAADAQYTYTFAGWDPEISKVEGNITYKATYTTEVNTYTVTWVDEDGTVLETDRNVPYGTTPKYDGATPTKEGNAQYTYVFAGWDPEVGPVEGDITYKATYTAEVNTYTVTWVDEDGTVLETDENVPYGTMPEYNGATPTKEADAKYTYTFAYWTPNVGPVEGDVTYKAVYSATTNGYTVIWKNWNGDVLEMDEDVPVGSVPEYNGATPTRPANAQYTYTFAGWDKKLEPVTEDVTYTATFTATVNTYTVTWVNEDGTVLETDENVPYGSTPEYNGVAPTKDATAQYTYTFKGWTPELSEVTGDVTYTATFTAAVNKYTVTWVDEDGSVLKIDRNVPYDTVPVYTGATPAKAGNAQYTYTFAGWTPSVTAVTGDVTYTATYTETVNEYTITWTNYDGTLLKREKVPYGTMPVYSGVTPTKRGDAQFGYTFSGWTPSIEEVTGDATYTAIYTEFIHTYTVTWKNGNEVLETDENVRYGEMPVYNGAEPTRAYTADNYHVYQFAGWTPEISEVTGNVTYTAVFEIVGLDGWVTEEEGTTYLVDGAKAYKSAWATIGGNVYYFDANGYIVTGLTEIDGTGYVFDENGVFLADYAGLYNDGNDTYWVEKGQVVVFAGLVKVVDAEGHIHYYYFDETNKAVKNGSYLVEKTNGLALPAMEYDFDENGVILHDEDTSKNGWVDEETGSYKTPDVPGTYNYIDGILIYEGLVQIDGDYYYINSNGMLVKGASCLVEKTNGLLIEDEYEFDEDGKLITKREIREENGVLYYYENNVRVYAGLILLDGDYYYVRSGGLVVCGQKYWVTKTNGLLPEGSYEFGEDGKMILPEDPEEPDVPDVPDEPKNGIVEEDGVLYYYVNDVRTYAGLIQIDGDYYYVRSGGLVVCGQKYWVTKTNGLLPEGSYEFGEDGKMILPEDPEEPEEPDVPDEPKNGIVEEDGGLYYYENGLRVYAGLIRIDGDYYYVRSNGALVVGQKYWVTKTNGLLPEGAYEFGADGKMILDEEPEEPDVPDEPLNGIVEEDGVLYYYENGLRVYAGLIQIDGDYYYVRSNGALVVSQKYWVTKTNGLLPEGAYEFGADGKMILPEDPEIPDVPDGPKNGIVEEDGVLYYYENGLRVYAGLILIDGDYYYVRSNGALVVNQTYWVTKTNGLLPEGAYEFGADGKMILDEEPEEPETPEVPEEPVEPLNGIVEEDGVLYYYENGLRVYAGLIQIDGDYYYVRSNGALVVNQTYWVTKTNDLLPEGSYEFGADGKMVLPEEPDEPVES